MKTVRKRNLLALSQNLEWNVKFWKRLSGDEREAYRQCNWFRAALDQSCIEGGHGAARELSIRLGFSEAAVSLMRSGRRTPDFKTAVIVALHFGHALSDFLSMGRDLAEPQSAVKRVAGKR